MRRTGAGCSGATTARGIRPRGYSGNRVRAIGAAWRGRYPTPSVSSAVANEVMKIMRTGRMFRFARGAIMRPQSNDLVSPLASLSGLGPSSLGTKHRKILIMGLPGAGKTTLAKALASRLNAVHFNADDVRREVHKDLGFREPDRIEHARRMGWLCDQVTKTGSFAIADFICPTPDARAAFTAGGEAFIVWMYRVTKSRFDDTDRMFVAPEFHDLRVPAGSSA